MKTLTKIREELLGEPEKLWLIQIPKLKIATSDRKKAKTVFNIFEEEGGEALFLESRTSEIIEFNTVELIATTTLISWALRNLEELTV